MENPPTLFNNNNNLLWQSTKTSPIPHARILPGISFPQRRQRCAISRLPCYVFCICMLGDQLLCHPSVRRQQERVCSGDNPPILPTCQHSAPLSQPGLSPKDGGRRTKRKDIPSKQESRDSSRVGEADNPPTHPT